MVAVFGLEKTPVPPLVPQLSDVMLVKVAVKLTGEELAQTVSFEPASIVGLGITVTCVVLPTALQMPLPCDVNVKFKTPPAFLVASVKTNLVLFCALLGVKTPEVGLSTVQTPLPVEELAERSMELVSPQTVKFGDTLTVGAGVMVTVRVLESAGQMPLTPGFDVTVRITEPFEMSAGVG